MFKQQKSSVNYHLLKGSAKDLEVALRKAQQEGENIYEAQYCNDTFLHMTVNEGTFDHLEVVLKFDFNLKAVNRMGQTALHRACTHRKAQAAVLLIKAAPETLLIKDHWGHTPLQLSCIDFSHTDLALFLKTVRNVGIDIDHNKLLQSTIGSIPGGKTFDEYKSTVKAILISAAEVTEASPEVQKIADLYVTYIESRNLYNKKSYNYSDTITQCKYQIADQVKQDNIKKQPEPAPHNKVVVEEVVEHQDDEQASTTEASTVTPTMQEAAPLHNIDELTVATLGDTA